MPAHSKTTLTLRANLEQVKKSTGTMPDGLRVPPCPPELAYLWTYYNDVKTEGPLTCTELLSWVKLTGNKLTPFEADVMRMLDVLFWRIANDRNRKASPTSRDAGKRSRKSRNPTARQVGE